MLYGETDVINISEALTPIVFDDLIHGSSIKHEEKWGDR
jgi:hypothetical protein